MARDFDGTNDQINFGSDATIDDFTALSFSFWVRVDSAVSQFDVIAEKTGGITGGWQIGYNTFDNPDRLYFQAGFSGMPGPDLATWAITNLAVGQIAHVAIVYDPSSTANDPVIYVNGSSVTVTETVTPVGTYGAENTVSMIMGENTSGNQDFDGALGWFCYDNALWDAAAVNRAKWWGRPHGGTKVYQPLVTGKLVNEASATATGTATGTTVAAFAVPVQRPGSAMMGMGIGW